MTIIGSITSHAFYFSYRKRRPEGNAEYDSEDYDRPRQQESDYPAYDDYEYDYLDAPARGPIRKRHPDYEYDDQYSPDYRDSGRRHGKGRVNRRRHHEQETQERDPADRDYFGDYTDERSDDYEDHQSQDYGDAQSQRRESGNRRRGRGGRYQRRPGQVTRSDRGHFLADERKDTEAKTEPAHSRRHGGGTRQQAGTPSFAYGE